MKALRWLALIAGVLLIVLGITMLSTPVENLITISLFICLSMLIYGIMMVIGYFSFDKQHRSGWMLVVGILSALLGGWMLFQGRLMTLTLVLPLIFSTWLIASSISAAVGSIDLKNMGIKGWGWQLALGIIGTILGFSLLFDPITSALSYP